MKRLIFLAVLVAGCGSTTTNVAGPTRSISDSAQVVDLDLNPYTLPRSRAIVKNQGPNAIFDVRVNLADDKRRQFFPFLVAPIMSVGQIDTVWIPKDTVIETTVYEFREFHLLEVRYSL